MSSSLLRRPLSMAVLMLLVLGASIGLGSGTGQANAPVKATSHGEMPTTGGVRPGPAGFNPPVRFGVKPVAIRIDTALVDAPIEVQPIVDRVMQNPSGPWVVAWYDATGSLGEDNNIVLAGHLDYWDVGEAVFWNVPQLEAGAEIVLTGEDGVDYVYAVDWVRSIELATADPREVTKMVSKTATEKLTLITCGGEFDQSTGQYKNRVIVRASRIR